MAGAVRVPRRDRDNNAKLTANLQRCQLREAHNARSADRVSVIAGTHEKTRARPPRPCCARADPLFIGRIRRAMISAGARYRSRRYSRASGVKGNYILASPVLRSSVRHVKVIGGETSRREISGRARADTDRTLP